MVMYELPESISLFLTTVAVLYLYSFESKKSIDEIRNIILFERDITAPLTQDYRLFTLRNKT